VRKQHFPVFKRGTVIRKTKSKNRAISTRIPPRTIFKRYHSKRILLVNSPCKIRNHQ
jgi:hypothetical protein